MSRPCISRTYGCPFYVSTSGFTIVSSDGEWRVKAVSQDKFIAMRRGSEIWIPDAGMAYYESGRVVLRYGNHIMAGVFYKGTCPKDLAYSNFLDAFNMRFGARKYLSERLEVVLPDRRWRRFLREADGDHALASICFSLF